MRKIRKFSYIILLCPAVYFSSCSKNETPTAPQFQTLEEEIDHIVKHHYRVGAAVGIINKQQQEQHFFYGSKTVGQNETPSAYTVFQIGSITKTFTATLLADMVLSGTVGLEDKAQTFLPDDNVTLPTRDGREITLKHLATHSSGIPKKPHGSSYPFPPGYDATNAYAAYTTEHIYDYLTNYCTLAFLPGERYLYSNTAVGLLGHILGLVHGSSFTELIQKKIFDPLGMSRTSLFMNEAQRSNAAHGYSSNFDVMPHFDANDIFQGAGFIKSSLNDMMIYLKVNMGLLSSAIRDAVDLTQQAHFVVGRVTYDDRPNEVFELTVGLGWHQHKSSDGRTYFWHGGSTNGFTSYIGFDQSNKTGAVILCNYEDVDIIIFGDKVLKAISRY